MLKRLILLFMIFVFTGSQACFADEELLKERIKQLETRIEALEKKFAEQDKHIKREETYNKEQDKKIAEYNLKFTELDAKLHRQMAIPTFVREGFQIGAGGTIIVQGTNNANVDGMKKRDRADGSYSADLTIENQFRQINGRVFLHLEAGKSDGLEDSLTLYSNVNRDADNDNNARVTELFYEQGMFNDKAVLTFGQLDPTLYFDNNEVANDETTQFLGRIFRNNPAIEFPDNTAGIRLAVMPVDWLKLSYGVFDANSDWKKIGDRLFNIAGLDFKTRILGLQGNYRVLGWHNNAKHTKWLDTAAEKEGTYGFGLSIDQKANDIVTLFARYGWQDPKLYNPDIVTTAGGFNYSLEQSWSAGFQIEGRPWGREKDVLGLAVGQDVPSGDYKKSNATLNARNEGHIEAYYNIYVNDYLSISPDFQYIWNPFGRDVVDDPESIAVYGLRTQIDF